MRSRLIAVFTVFTVFLSIFFTAGDISFAQNGKDDNPDESDITIVMAGDILLHTPVEEAARDESGAYNFDFIFQKLKRDISSADLAIVNQEVIIGGQELGISGYPAFNAPYQIGDALVNAGFDVVCHGTNHALDKGKSGVLNCCKYWKEQHPQITVLGINETEEEYNEVTVLEKKGVKIAILNYTYGTNGISQPKGMPHAVDMLDETKVVRDLKYAEENADFTIVCPHWGTEYKLGTDSNQKYWTKVFRKNGADLVLGTHPHVIEPIEMLEDESVGISNNHGNGDMLVYYSLGNFVNWTSGKGKGIANRMVGGLARVTIGKDSGGEVVIKNHDVMPVVCHLRKGYEGVIVYPLKDYTDQLGKENAIALQDPSFSASYCRELASSIW